MNIIFRVDASVNIGSGHLMRCVTLAERLRIDGYEIAFICMDMQGAMFEFLKLKKIKFEKISSIDNSSQEADASMTIEVANKIFPNGVNWIVVDHYGLDSKWENFLSHKFERIMVIDDIANRSHNCDILVDQNYEDASRYSNLVNKKSILLLGPNYALLNPEYAHYRKLRQQKYSLTMVRKVLVFFGGSDPSDLTGKALEALTFPKLNELDVDIVVGNNYAYYDKLKYSANIRGRTRIYKFRKHLADLMANADIAIGGGGVTNWERMCIGLSSIVITLAENQVPICQILSRKGAIRLLGCSKVVSTQDILKAFLEEMDSNLILNRASIAKDLCDGMGLDRVVNEMRLIQ